MTFKTFTHKGIKIKLKLLNIQQGLNRVESMGSLGHRALLQFLDLEDLLGLKTFLDNRGAQVDDRDENATTILMVAATKGLVLFVKELIARSADTHASDLDNWTALLCASKAGHLEVVEILIEHGADVEHRDMVRIVENYIFFQFVILSF